jgi:hypothetical protein
MNGRAAFLDIKRQAEGTAATTTLKARAYKSIATATYSGTSQRYTFDKYLETHQKSHVTLADLGEPIAESKKVDDFLKGITDPRLTTNKQIIDSDQTKLNDFEACAQYLKTSVLRTTIRNPDNRHIAAFMMQQQGGDNNNNRRDRGGGKRPPTDNNRNRFNNKKQRNQPRNQPRVHGGHYEPEEWNQLSNDEKAEVQRLRQVKKQQRTTGRAIGEVMPQPQVPPTPTTTTIAAITTTSTNNTTAPVVVGALRRNVPHWVPTAPRQAIQALTLPPVVPPTLVMAPPTVVTTPSVSLKDSKNIVYRWQHASNELMHWKKNSISIRQLSPTVTRNRTARVMFTLILTNKSVNASENKLYAYNKRTVLPLRPSTPNKIKKPLDINRWYSLWLVHIIFMFSHHLPAFYYLIGLSLWFPLTYLP